MKTVAQLAQELGLTEITNKGQPEYIGPNPFEPGATEDGFALIGSGEYWGTAHDRKLHRTYSCKQIAQFAGIPLEEYEPIATKQRPAFVPARNGHKSNGIANGSGPGAGDNNLTEEAQAVPVYPTSDVVYDTRSLSERGVKRETLGFFKVIYRGSGEGEDSWGPVWIWPTYHADGTEAQSRRKYRYPDRQLTANPGKKPRKADWHNPTASKGRPPGYNINNVLGAPECWLVNSELAVWLFHQEGTPAICPLGEGRSVESYQKILTPLIDAGLNHLHILLDNDKGGKDGSVNVFDACTALGLACTVYDLTTAPKDKYDASDLWEWWNEHCKRTPAFIDVLKDQAQADRVLIEAWRNGYKTIQAQEEAQAAAATVERHLNEAGQAIEKTYRKCPKCKKQTVIKNEYGAGWLCYEKMGGCGAKFAEGTEDIEKQKGTTKDNRANELLAMVSGHQLFHTGDGNEYCVVIDKGKRITYKIESEAFQTWCKYIYLRDKGVVIPPDTVKAAIGSLKALARHEGAQLRAHVRTGELGGKIYIDLADPAGQSVEVDETGWRITDNAGIFFRRPPGLKELPAPVHQTPEEARETWEEFRRIINVGDDRNWILVVCWLAFALLPAEEDSDCPILSVHGQQGSAKSMLCRIVRNTIDDNAGYMVSWAKEERDVVTAAENGRVFCLDNQTKMPEWLSNLISSMVTGTPYRCRQLFTDDGSERLYTGQPAIIINGIPDKIGGIDLNDRALKINVPILSDSGYKEKRTILQAWRKLRPRLLGVILDAVVAGLKYRDQAKDLLNGKPLPRMADFTMFSVAAEHGGAFPWEPGTFYDSYMGNISEAAQVDLEDVLGQAILQLLEKCENGRFEGPGAQLYNRLFDHAVTMMLDHEAYDACTLHGDENGKRRIVEDAQRVLRANRRFPGHYTRMGVMLTEIAPSLRKRGIVVLSNKNRLGTNYTIMRVTENPQNAGMGIVAQAQAAEIETQTAEEIEAPADPVADPFADLDDDPFADE